MAVEHRELVTDRGDRVRVTLFAHSGEAPSVVMTIDDVDECRVPTASLNVRELGELRELLRELGEVVRGLERAGVVRV